LATELEKCEEEINYLKTLLNEKETEKIMDSNVLSNKLREEMAAL